MDRQGWSGDSTGRFNSPTENAGFIKRRTLFLESKNTTTEVYTDKTVALFGVLNTNFQTIKKRK